MAYTVKFVNPIRSSFSSFIYCSSSSSSSLISRTQSRAAANVKFELIRTWVKQKQLQPASTHNRFWKFIQTQTTHNAHLSCTQFSGSTLSIGGLLGVSFIIGSIGCCQQITYAMDGQDILVDDRDFSSDSYVGKDFPLIWVFVRKLWLPVFFVLTVFLNWNHPVMLITKVVLFLFSTKPSPLSVYVFVEQLCQQSMSEKPYLYLLKSLYAKKVEVEDYKLFCLATIEVKDQKLTLVGVLGGWWALPLSQTAFSAFWNSALY